MSPDPLAPPPRQTPDPGPKSVPVLVEPIDPAVVPATSTPAPRAPDVVQPRSGLAGWAREHKRTVLCVGGGLLALCLVLLIVLPRLGSGDNTDRRPSDEDEDGSQLSEKPRETVFGTVKYGGKTVPVGTIMFHPEKGRGAVAEIQNGKYRTDMVPAGPVKVTVSTTQMRRTYKAVEQQRKSGQPAPGLVPVGIVGGQVPRPKDKLKDKQPPELPGAAEIAKTQDKAWENIKDMIDVPEKFEDPEKSDLKFEIKSGSQEIPINLPKLEGFKPKK